MLDSLGAGLPADNLLLIAVVVVLLPWTLTVLIYAAWRDRWEPIALWGAGVVLMLFAVGLVVLTISD